MANSSTDPRPMSDADAFMDGYFTGLLVGYLTRRGLTHEQAEAEIALGCCSAYQLVQTVASDPSDAVRWAAQARAYRESRGPT